MDLQNSSRRIRIAPGPSCKRPDQTRNTQPVVAKLSERDINPPVFDSPSDKLNGYTICLDSLQGCKIEIISFHPEGSVYGGTFKVTYYDHFGLDSGDFTTDGYSSFKSLAVNSLAGFKQWDILQRWKDLAVTNHPKPFITTVEITDSF